MAKAKRPRTPAQLANDERLRNRAKEKKVEESLAAPEPEKQDIQTDQSTLDMQRQINELKAMLLDQQIAKQTATLNNKGSLVGEVEKYSTEKGHYPDPTPRLRAEKRLQPLAFDYNYELDYSVSVTTYETKTGINMREPKFNITLNRIVLDEQGEQTNKRYIVRKLIFHEDPEAAMVVARENGLKVESDNEEWFLNEMRYLRVRDWLFGIFWPKPSDESAQILEEVIGGQIVQVFTKSSEDSSEVEFDKLGGKKLGA